MSLLIKATEFAKPQTVNSFVVLFVGTSFLQQRSKKSQLEIDFMASLKWPINPTDGI